MERRYRQISLEERCTIAALRENGQSLAKIATALDRSASSISRELKRNRGVTSLLTLTTGQRPAVGQGCVSNAIQLCVKPSSAAWLKAGLLNRSAGGWPRSIDIMSSAMKASTASSMHRSGAPKIMTGGIISHAPNQNEVTGAKQGAQPAPFPTAPPSPTDQKPSMIAPYPDIGKAT